MNATLLAMWQAVPESQLKVPLDIAQLLMSVGLIWAAGRMSMSFDHVRDGLKELGVKVDGLSAALAKTVLDVRELQTRDEARRDRRHDDA